MASRQSTAWISATPLFCSICGLTFYGPHFAAPHHADYLPPGTDNDDEGVENRIGEEAAEYHAEIVKHLSWQHEATLLSDVIDEFPVLEQHYKGGKRAGIGRYEGTELDYEAVMEREGGGSGSRSGGAGEICEGIRMETAVFTGIDDIFRLDDTGEQVKANDHVGHDEMRRWTSMYRIAVHKGCMSVARDFIAHQQRGSVTTSSAGDARVRNLRALWKVLRMRWDALDNMLMLTRGEVLAPAYGALKGRGVYKYPSFGDEMLQFHERWVEQDPRCEAVLGDQSEKARILVDAVGLAPEVVKTEKEVEDKSSKETFRARFYSLPQELQDAIADQIVTREGLELECTGILGQETWMDILARGQALPWLGPLDRRRLEQAAATRIACLGHESKEEKRSGPTLDWELLVRRLSQPIKTKQRMGLPVTRAGIETVTYTSVTECLCDFIPASSVPDALRSRKWRWEILEKMYVGDVLPVWTDWMQRESERDPALPRYWDEFGERAWPVDRVMGDAEKDW